MRCRLLHTNRPHPVSLLMLGCFALCAGRSHVGAPFRRGARAVWALRGGSGEWTAHSAEDGQTYYFNAVTGESSWELPPGASVPSGGAADFLGGWSAHTTDDGQIYYYNAETDESTWDPPPGFEAGGFETAGGGQADEPAAAAPAGTDADAVFGDSASDAAGRGDVGEEGGETGIAAAETAGPSAAADATTAASVEDLAAGEAALTGGGAMLAVEPSPTGDGGGSSAEEEAEEPASTAGGATEVGDPPSAEKAAAEKMAAELPAQHGEGEAQAERAAAEAPPGEAAGAGPERRRGWSLFAWCCGGEAEEEAAEEAVGEPAPRADGRLGAPAAVGRESEGRGERKVARLEQRQ